MLEAGSKYSHLIQFVHGQPTSELTYTLYNQDGDVVLTNDVAISVGQVSYLVEIPGAENVMTKPAFEQMKLEWEYTTASEAITDSIHYTLRAPIGFPVTEDGVRRLLGVDKGELPDDEINLFEAHLQLKSQLTDETVLIPYIDAGSYDSYKITIAIEAMAALNVFANLQIRLPKKYDSGTSAWERWTTIDWGLLHANLLARVSDAFAVLEPDLELYPVTDIFGLSDRGTDAITGA